MNANAEWLRDEKGDLILPVTSTKAVLDKDGNTVEDLLDEKVNGEEVEELLKDKVDKTDISNMVTHELAGSSIDIPTISGGSNYNYSTEEQIVGKWIDGSTVYSKTLYAETGTGQTHYDITIQSVTDINIIDFHGIISNDKNYYRRKENFVQSSNNSYSLIAITTSGNLLWMFTMPEPDKNFKLYLTIYYTKVNE